jgi:mono/diheme cytochrome c family protein
VSRRALLSLLLGIAAGVTVVPAARADPPADYMLHCRGCHGPDGRGIAEGAPSLRDFVGKFLWVPGGREYLVQVPGTAQSELSDARTAAVLNWMVYEFSPNEVPPDFAQYTEAEVGPLRRRPLTDVVRVRRALTEIIAARAAAAH